jgi:integrase/recombinase XerD
MTSTENGTIRSGRAPTSRHADSCSSYFAAVPKRLPVVLSAEEVQRLIAGAKNLYHRTLLLTLYGTGLRRSEVCHLKVRDIDSQRMVLRVQQGKGHRDRDVPLSPTLLTALREYYRWMRPQTYLFPGMVGGWRADKPITAKVIWTAVHSAAVTAGLEKRVAPPHAASLFRGSQP